MAPLLEHFLHLEEDIRLHHHERGEGHVSKHGVTVSGYTQALFTLYLYLTQFLLLGPKIRRAFAGIFNAADSVNKRLSCWYTSSVGDVTEEVYTRQTTTKYRPLL